MALQQEAEQKLATERAKATDGNTFKKVVIDNFCINLSGYKHTSDICPQRMERHCRRRVR